MPSLSTRPNLRLAIIVPTLNEGASLADTMQALQGLRSVREPYHPVRIIVADGGSTDGSINQALHTLVDAVIAAPRGRASQMNAGAEYALLNWPEWPTEALLFLHADTYLPTQKSNIIEAIGIALDAAPNTARSAAMPYSWGRFDVRLRLDPNAPTLRPWSRAGLRLVEAMMNLRSRLTGIATGDQAMFMSSALFIKLGGFPDQALMEDIAFSSAAKRLSPPASLRLKVSTSARRWQTHGVVTTILRMWRYRAAYYFGASPQTLAAAYGYAQQPAPAPRIAVLAKAPLPGLAKTRLIPALGEHGAARLARQFLLSTLSRSAAHNTDLWCAPNPNQRIFRALAKRCGTLSLHQQVSGNIGERMRAAAQYHFATYPNCALLIVGTDCPSMQSVHYQHAARVLLDKDIVLIPANDGGYVLLGMRQYYPAVFDNIAWSTEQVMTQTRHQLQTLGLSWAELPSLSDIDTPDDLRSLNSSTNAPPPTNDEQ